eukprot:1194598-Prorocentrum_minimum.AAC.2
MTGALWILIFVTPIAFCTPKAPELQQEILGIAIVLLRNGHVEEVMTFADQWVNGKAHPDPSLVRYFLTKLLRITEPPYSQYFASAVIRLMSLAGEPVDAREHLVEFVESSLYAEYNPPLSKEDRSELVKISRKLHLSH